ncbi:MAG: S8 family serine peptidase [Thermoleophilia bacterium]|nr:S8 family serine peptidase [Thermoleophilia bacterium]
MAVLVAAVALGGLTLSSASGYAVDTKRYIITLDGDYAVTDGYAVGSDYAVYAVTHQYAVYAVQAAGGTITNDLSKQIGVIVAESANGNFAQLVQEYAVTGGYAVIDSVSEDRSVTPKGADAQPKSDNRRSNPDLHDDPAENLQWDMKMIRTNQAHARHAGSRTVDVGVLDTGVDSTHVDFTDMGVLGGSSNVDCSRARVSVTPGVGAPLPCTDTSFHGTHVAGSIAAQSNGVGIVGVAPDVTLVPVTVCQAYACWWSAVVDGITYAGDIKLDVVNMSFYADDEQLIECNPQDSATVTAIERAIAYARSRGVVPVAALGNSRLDLGSPQYADCRVVPGQTPGVIGVSSIGADGVKASYSNYGFGAVDVTAPGGNGSTGGDADASDGRAAVYSTFPGSQYLTANGTSMASPHAAGVAALIVSRYGKVAPDGDVVMKPDQVEAKLKETSVDIGAAGYDSFYGYGRVDALRAIGG